MDNFVLPLRSMYFFVFIRGSYTTVVSKSVSELVSHPVPNPVTIPGTPTISYQSTIGVCTATCAWNKKIYWHGHLQLIEFPVLEFHLMKSELNYLSSL